MSNFQFRSSRIAPVIHTTRLFSSASLIVAVATLSASPLASAAGASKTFWMKVSPGAAACLPDARGRVTVSSLGAVENLHVEVSGLKPSTDYDLFVTQVPNPPFGLSWYQGDIETNAKGAGVGDFVGRFSAETFIVAPGAAFVPKPLHIGDAPFGAKNPPVTAPIHTFHLGIWFNSAKDASDAGCPGFVTPFNGDHTAGIQVVNTGGYPDTEGPLRSFNP
jgi:hypothetical protein